MTVPCVHLISEVSKLIRRDLVLSLRVAQVLYRLPGLVQGVEGVEALDVALLLSGVQIGALNEGYLKALSTFSVIVKYSRIFA